LALTAALLLHLALTRVAVVGRTPGPAKPLTTQFVKRRPRLTKPLELKKRPQPKRRQLRREMVSLEAKANRKGVTSSVRPLEALGSLARPGTEMTRSAGFPAEVWEPQAAAQVVEGSRESQHMVDMSLEMVDIDALDTGQYHAMVVQNPSDRRDLRGFFHFYLAHPRTAIRLDWSQDRARVDHGMVVLVDAMNKYTQIRTEIAGRTTFDSKELFRTPWVYSSAPPQSVFKLTGGEAANLGRYLLSGGFFFADGHQWKGTPGDIVMRNMIRDALAAVDVIEGSDWVFDVLPNTHPLYHCYFDFDGPPKGSQPGAAEPDNPLEGVHHRGRMVAIMSNRWYASPWGNWGWWPGYEHLDNTRQVQFGVNLVVFALTQEGSITSQVMDSVR
jgi:hypothetical protein